MAKQTPMMRQYLEIKSQYPDAILFFRLGDFYEMFLDDAVIAAKVLDIALTSRNKGAEEQIPLCGIPYHSAQPYLSRLVAAGHKVAICEQVEDPRMAKGIVRREVVRLVTPGTVLEPELLSADRNSYLLAISCSARQRYGLASLDLSTGQFRVTSAQHPEEVRRELLAIEARELLVAEGERATLVTRLALAPEQVASLATLPDGVFTAEEGAARLNACYGTSDLTVFGCADDEAAIAAAGAVLYYVEQTQKGQAAHLRPLTCYQIQDSMVLDEATRRNLELTQTLSGAQRKGSLLGALDRTLTAMGGRLLRQWLLRPLLDCQAIDARLDFIAQAIDQPRQRQQLRELLRTINDLERLLSRISMGSASARDLVALRNSCQPLPPLRQLCGELAGVLAARLHQQIDPLEDMAGLLARALADEPPAGLRDGGLIRDGYDQPLDELRQISRDGKGFIARLERQERERSGIASLKVRYNRVFGYYIDVPKTQLAKVPVDYQRKQTLANSERYFTPELKDYEDRVLGAEEAIAEREYQLFEELRQQIGAARQRIQATAEGLAALDVLLALADVAHERNYCRPRLHEGARLEIIAGRHPVVELLTGSDPFVSNDVLLDTDSHQLLMVTGPNMAGKSTFMRQVALITLMAQMGSFVPAQQAEIGLVDRIFTRVGASDNLARGQSTFMVEMSETAYILNHATPRSLILLDEIGRGTSTFDGISIAWAVAEYLHDNPQLAAKTLFATHYHELTDLSRTRKGIENFNIAVRQWQDQIVFLRTIVPGPASHSYGIQVAQLAGLPQPVIRRAKEILANLERGEYSDEGLPLLAQSQKSDRKTSAAPVDPLRQRLRQLDINRMTPLEALSCIHELCQLLDD
ncbi:DNA mismatch repair protein MutS [Desulfuromonas thiophila]|uniref:DNA mismatch repair protein MutS n=1 Tax=Desulfuromonas thiophila TaxID=57664 RepID=A0A1G7EAU5_9BACT|nr:DNA mismatch repair protein MutS [Desulfuromonas thiophila]SDE60767.1 DNA mismatch repair protein MutS [Desulfuromonas thiophila]